MEKEFYLNDEDRIILEEFHRACLDKKTADKIKAILLLSQGFTYAEIEKILLLDERTLNRYKQLYKSEGIDGLVANNYQGSRYKLSDDQIKELQQELDSKIYRTSEEICEYVWKTFKVKHTAQGMVQTLHRIGYSYKKASSVPGKADKEKQEAFVRRYKRRYKKLSEDEKVYFMDGNHPTFNNHIGYGWIRKGERFEIKSQDDRKRINLLGAYNPKEGEVLLQDYERINGEAVIAFLRELRKRNGEKKLHVICDNARCQHAKEAKAAAKSLKIHLIYLPGYSPNLNLIERYWGFMKKRVLVNHHYETYERFRETILLFSRNKSKRLKELLQRYIPEKFHVIEPVFT
ncbi:MAG: IS630 family transposase [Treponema sp.]|jgi:transposase|nr:IS630 family transposase [Treponema sp.]